VSDGIANHVVDSASIEGNLRRHRAKTDRLEVGSLLCPLVRYRAGKRTVWKVVHVPTGAAEDARQLHRELLTAKRDRARVMNRITRLLANQGVVLPRLGAGAQVVRVRRWDGSPLPAGLVARLGRDGAKVELFTTQIRALEAARQVAVRTATDPALGQVRQLVRLRGIGLNSAWLSVMEFVGWRGFRNRREVGALAGLTPTPYQRGEQSRAQRIAKAGNRYIRAMAIEIAWGVAAVSARERAEPVASGAVWPGEQSPGSSRARLGSPGTRSGRRRVLRTKDA
jgi:transposase